MRALPAFRSARVHTLALAFVVAAASSSAAQTNRFTVDDVLNGSNVSISDVSRDGRWLAVTSATLRDRLGNDNRRYGDPSYLAPGSVDLLVIDTRNGQSQKVFADRRQVRSMRWSPDGSRLALLARKADGFEALIWDRATGKIRPLVLPKDRTVADNSALQWSDNGQQIYLALRESAWRKQAAEGFTKLTSDAIVVQSSSKPFMA